MADPSLDGLTIEMLWADVRILNDEAVQEMAHMWRVLGERFLDAGQRLHDQRTTLGQTWLGEASDAFATHAATSSLSMYEASSTALANSGSMQMVALAIGQAQRDMAALWAEYQAARTEIENHKDREVKDGEPGGFGEALARLFGAQSPEVKKATALMEAQEEYSRRARAIVRPMLDTAAETTIIQLPVFAGPKTGMPNMAEVPFFAPPSVAAPPPPPPPPGAPGGAPPPPGAPGGAPPPPPPAAPPGVPAPPPPTAPPVPAPPAPVAPPPGTGVPAPPGAGVPVPPGAGVPAPPGLGGQRAAVPPVPAPGVPAPAPAVPVPPRATVPGAAVPPPPGAVPPPRGGAVPPVPGVVPRPAPPVLGRPTVPGVVAPGTPPGGRVPVLGRGVPAPGLATPPARPGRTTPGLGGARPIPGAIPPVAPAGAGSRTGARPGAIPPVAPGGAGSRTGARPGAVRPGAQPALPATGVPGSVPPGGAQRRAGPPALRPAALTGELGTTARPATPNLAGARAATPPAPPPPSGPVLGRNTERRPARGTARRPLTAAPRQPVHDGPWQTAPVNRVNLTGLRRPPALAPETPQPTLPGARDQAARPVATGPQRDRKPAYEPPRVETGIDVAPEDGLWETAPAPAAIVDGPIAERPVRVAEPAIAGLVR
jgi:hypothetical protein